MTEPRTLLQLSGADLTPAKLRDAVLILIDMQNEYVAGPIAVSGVDSAVDRAAVLLAAAREAGSPVVHVAHAGKAGSLFDRSAERGAFVAALEPQPGETIIEKGLPNAFAGTNLQDVLAGAARENLIVAGFMTHMCVSSTARAALDLGYRVTIGAPACATRDLPDGRGGIVAAETLHDVALVELSDRFAIIAHSVDELV